MSIIENESVYPRPQPRPRKPKVPKVTMTIRLEPELLDRINAQAKRKEVSQTLFVKHYMREVCAELEAEQVGEVPKVPVASPC